MKNAPLTSLPLPALLLLMSASAMAQVSPVDVGQLPLNSRNLSALTALTPDVQPAPLTEAEGVSSVLQALKDCATVGGEGCPDPAQVAQRRAGDDVEKPTPPALETSDDDEGLNTVRPSLGGMAGDRSASSDGAGGGAVLDGAGSVGGLFASLATNGTGAGSAGSRTAHVNAPAPSTSGLVQNFHGFSAGGSSYINGTDPGKMTAAAASMLGALNSDVQQTNNQQNSDARPIPDRAVRGQ